MSFSARIKLRCEKYLGSWGNAECQTYIGPNRPMPCAISLVLQQGLMDNRQRRPQPDWKVAVGLAMA